MTSSSYVGAATLTAGGASFAAEVELRSFPAGDLLAWSGYGTVPSEARAPLMAAIGQTLTIELPSGATGQCHVDDVGAGPHGSTVVTMVGTDAPPF